jgi:hypothetical protein
LLNPTETHFLAKFLVVERLLKLILAIKEIVADPNWTTFVNSLCGNHRPKLLTKAKAIRGNIKRDEFGILVLILYTWWNWF